MSNSQYSDLPEEYSAPSVPSLPDTEDEDDELEEDPAIMPYAQPTQALAEDDPLITAMCGGTRCIRYVQHGDQVDTENVFLFFEIGNPAAGKLGSMYCCAGSARDKLHAEEMQVLDITDIFAGRQHHIFDAFDENHPDDALCFSLVSATKEIHVSCQEADHANMWLDGLQHLLTYFGSTVVVAEEDEIDDPLSAFSPPAAPACPYSNEERDGEKEESGLAADMAALNVTPAAASSAAAPSASATSSTSLPTEHKTPASASSPSTPLEGVLTYYESGKALTTRKYLQVRGDQLEMFECDGTKPESKLVSSFGLFDASLTFEPGNGITGTEHLFSVSFADGNKLVLGALSLEQRNEWVESLKAHISTLVAASTAKSDEKSLKEGFLSKLGNLRKHWQRRHFRLLDSSLEYWSDRTGGSRLGVIALSGASVEADQSKPTLFKVTPMGSTRTFMLEAGSIEEREEWMAAIKKQSELPRLYFDSLREGFLHKKGDTNKAWKQRYFVLRNNVVMYFKSPQDKKCAGQIDLSRGAQLLRSPKEASNRPHAFALAPIGSKRKYILAADNAEDMERWLSVIGGLLEKNFTSTQRLETRALEC